MSEELDHDIELLHAVLADVTERLGPPGHGQLVERLLELRAGGEQDGFAAARKHIASLTTAELGDLIKTLTLHFRLRNQAEKVAIVRINRRRRREATTYQPRKESIHEAVLRLKSRGVSYGALMDVLGRIDIQPTLTAHPTESRRRTLLRKQRDIADCLDALREPAQDAHTRRKLEDAIRQSVLLLYGTDEVRIEKLSVLEEIEGSLYFLASSIWKAVPHVLRDLADAVELYYGQRPNVPALIRYRTWIGGDRDGNPRVTPAMTLESLRLHRQAAVKLYEEKLSDLLGLLSLSDRRIAVPPELAASVQPEQLAELVPEATMTRLRHEPFRLKLLQMRRRLAAAADGEGSYNADRFIEDLDLLAESLRRMRLGEIVDSSGLGDLMAQARAFGLHLAALDVRQHSGVHEQVVADIVGGLGACGDYRALSDLERVALLTRLLADSSLRRPAVEALAPGSRDALEVLDILKAARAADPRAVGSYVISMAHEVSDVLEVVFLMRLAGCMDLDVVPLFETIDDLARSPALLEAMLDHPLYREHVERRGRFQEIMLGYSDSNKDGGYFMSSRLLHAAQSQLAAVCRQRGLSFRFFHGRGGTVGRGGGRSNRAILATPPDSRSGRIRMTEQGEVISFRYAMPDIAHRHLEQLISAMILAESEWSGPAVKRVESEEKLLDRLGVTSMAAYRQLIDDPDFWPWFTTVSPIRHISRLPIASRPVSRGSGTVDIDNLRAIPWVFAWTQTRFNVPGWYGIGTALREADESPQTMTTLTRWYREWDYFRTLIDNAQQEMARARLPIARCNDELGAVSLYPRIAGEFDRARSAMLRITGQHELLDNNRVIQLSIAQRNPLTDLLHLIQLELMRRYRQADDNGQEELRPLLFASINGIAAAMQSTG